MNVFTLLLEKTGALFLKNFEASILGLPCLHSFWSYFVSLSLEERKVKGCDYPKTFLSSLAIGWDEG